MKFKQNTLDGSDCCPFCNDHRCELVSEESGTGTIRLKMYCTECEMEWQETYEMTEVIAITEEGKPFRTTDEYQQRGEKNEREI